MGPIAVHGVELVVLIVEIRIDAGCDAVWDIANGRLVGESRVVRCRGTSDNGEAGNSHPVQSGLHVIFSLGSGL